MKVLVVDDDPDVLESTLMLMEALGHEPLGCRRAHEVLDVVRSTAPDVVLHDVHMPGLDLQEQLRSLRADPAGARLPVLLFTAAARVGEVQGRADVQGVVTKPFQAEELERALAAVTER